MQTTPPHRGDGRLMKFAVGLLFLRCGTAAARAALTGSFTVDGAWESGD